MPFQLIDTSLLNQLAERAQDVPRKRQHYNLHADYQEPCQRLLNAVEPDSYIRPHRHRTPPKPECFIALRGRFLAIVFDDTGRIESAFLLGPDQACRGIDLAAGTWHSIVSLDSGGVFFEAKPGPFEPLEDKDFAFWAPVEGSPEAAGYLVSLRQRAMQVVSTQKRE